MILRFCGQDEDHDPSEDFEEYMSCIVCGDNCKLWQHSKFKENEMDESTSLVDFPMLDF